MKSQRLAKILAAFARRPVLVVGDVMLDQFLWGRVSRISPEAPVPVVEVTNESFFPGGAANVARNLRALGVPTQVLGVVGDDTAGLQLRQQLEEREVDTNGLIVDPDRPTTLKTRIIAHHQQVVRFDREKQLPISKAVTNRLLARFAQELPSVSAVIFEDYGKGLLSQRLLNRMNRQARLQGKVTAADPNSRHPLQFTGLSAVTPNRTEAFAAAGLPAAEALDDVLSDDPLLRAGAALLRKWKPDNLLITLGEHGMCLFRPGRRPHHIPTAAQDVFDVSGAGDTVIASLTAALVAGANPVEAAEISNQAAGIVVGKVGTATCSAAELKARLG